MISEISDKLDELIDEIDNNPKVLKLKQLKEQIYKDENLKQQLEQFRNLDNEYSSKYIELKKLILENPLVKEYKLLENELYFCVLEVNKRLNTLLDRKKCC